MPENIPYLHYFTRHPQRHHTKPWDDFGILFWEKQMIHTSGISDCFLLLPRESHPAGLKMHPSTGMTICQTIIFDQKSTQFLDKAHLL